MTPFFRGMLIFLLFWTLWLGASLYALAQDRVFRSPIGEQFIIYAEKPCFRADIHAARLAEWRHEDDVVRGCWIESDGFVFIAFEDGDRAMLEVDKLLPLQ